MHPTRPLRRCANATMRERHSALNRAHASVGIRAGQPAYLGDAPRTAGHKPRALTAWWLAGTLA